MWLDQETGSSAEGDRVEGLKIFFGSDEDEVTK